MAVKIRYWIENIKECYLNFCEFLVEKNKIYKILESIIPFEIFFVIREFIKLIKKEKKYIFFFFILLPPTILIISIMALIYITYFIYLLNKFFYFLIKKKYKVIKYKEWKTKFKNSNKIILKKIFWEKPTTMCFYNFYYITKIIVEKKEKMDIEKIIFIIWNIIIRIVILIITKIPLIVSKTIMEFLLKTNNVLKNNNKKINLDLLKYIIVQYLISTSSEINYIIKKLKIKFLKKKIKFNFDVKRFIESIKYKKGLKDAMFLTKQKTEINFLKHKKSDKILTEKLKKFYLKNNIDIYNKLNENEFFKKKLIEKRILENILREGKKIDKKTEKFLEEYLIKTKPHLTIFYKNEGGDIIYKNETSNKKLLIYNNKTKSIEEIELNFLHEGSINPKKITYYTPNIITKQENIEENQNENLIQNIQNIEKSTHNLLLSFLMDANKEGLKTKYIEIEEEICLIREDELTKNNILKTLNKDEIIREAQEIFQYFLEQNNELFESIKIENKEQIIREILGNYYKTELFKNSNFIFYILKK